MIIDHARATVMSAVIRTKRKGFPMDGIQLQMFTQPTDPAFARFGDAVRNAIRSMSPYWTSSREKIIDAYGTRRFTEVVKHEYCPYGASGSYGHDYGKKGVFTLTGWDMRTRGIEFHYEPMMIQTMTWNEFAWFIGEFIRNGEYVEDEE